MSDAADEGISEVIAEILIAVLIVMLGLVILGIISGVLPVIAKSAYLVTNISIGDVSGHSVVTVYHRGGEPVHFNSTLLTSSVAAFYVDTPSGTHRAEPLPPLASFAPGDTVYISYSGTGYIVTGDRSLVSASLPELPRSVRLVDETHGILISSMDFPMALKTSATTMPPTPSPSPATTATVTATAATTVTTGATTAAPTPTATIPATHSITVTWSPPGLGSVSPPGTNGGTVSVVHGASQTFSAIPHPNKAVLTITLDGVTVYTGSSKGVTVAYTVNNVQAGHTLIVAFG